MWFDTHSTALAALRDSTKLNDLLESIKKRKEGFSGLWLSPGGADIDPKLYGEEETYTHWTTPNVDAAEFLIIKAILDSHQPLLAICRGHQLLAAAIGGKLFQDINAETGIHHGAHSTIEIQSGPLEDIFQVKTINANSLHHQAVKELHCGWQVGAIAEDGICENIWHEDHPEVISVQFHPEMMRYDYIERIVNYLNDFVV